MEQLEERLVALATVADAFEPDAVVAGDVRRAKLYYLRDRVGKKSRVREKATWMSQRQDAAAEPVVDEIVAVEEAVEVEEAPASE